jgi:hypothetical protein
MQLKLLDPLMRPAVWTGGANLSRLTRSPRPPIRMTLQRAFPRIWFTSHAILPPILRQEDAPEAAGNIGSFKREYWFFRITEFCSQDIRPLYIPQFGICRAFIP